MYCNNADKYTSLGPHKVPYFHRSQLMLFLYISSGKIFSLPHGKCTLTFTSENFRYRIFFFPPVLFSMHIISMQGCVTSVSEVHER